MSSDDDQRKYMSEAGGRLLAEAEREVEADLEAAASAEATAEERKGSR